MFELRPYQKECVNMILSRLQKGVRLQVAVLATWLGKTLILSQFPPILKKKGKKTLILAHREELLQQAKEKVLAIDPTLSVQIEQGENVADPASDVIIASVQTLGRENSERIKRINPESVGLIIIDESHHCTWQTYQNILSYFWANKQTGLKPNHPVVLWFTATPNRRDNVWLDQIFDELVYKYDIKDWIENGYLANIKAYTILTNESIDNVSSRNWDFAIEELSNAINNEHRNSLIVKSYEKICKWETAVVFAVDVKHSEDLAEAFRKKGRHAESITGNTESTERKRILQEFASWVIDIVVNVGVLTEGYDNPRIKAVLLARPTKSAWLFVQQVGRGTRLVEWKTFVKLLDFVDNFWKNNIITSSTLIGLDKPIKADGHMIMGLKEKYETLLSNDPCANISDIDIDDLDQRIQEVDIFKISQLPQVIKNCSSYAWTPFLEGFKLSLGKSQTGDLITCEIRENTIGQYEATFYSILNEKVSAKTWYRKQTIKIHSLVTKDKITCIEQADLYIYANYKDRVSLVSQDATWRQWWATEKQVSILKRFGYPNADKLTKWEACNLLNKVFAEREAKKAKK